MLGRFAQTRLLDHLLCQYLVCSSALPRGRVDVEKTFLMLLADAEVALLQADEPGHLHVQPPLSVCAPDRCWTLIVQKLVRNSSSSGERRPGWSKPLSSGEVSSKRRIRSQRARRQQGQRQLRHFCIYHAVDAPRTSARKHRVADTRCFLNVSRGSGRRAKRRRSCSAASTSAVGWEAPVRTRSIICFGDWRTPESLQAVKLTAQQDRQRNSHRDTAIRNAKRSANTEIPTHD